MDLDAGVGLSRDPEQVRIVVAENDVDGTRILLQLIHHEWRAEVAAADQEVRFAAQVARSRDEDCGDDRGCRR